MQKIPKILIFPVVAIVSLIVWTLVISSVMGVSPSKAVSALTSSERQTTVSDTTAIAHKLPSDSVDMVPVAPEESDSTAKIAAAIPEETDTLLNTLAQIAKEKAELEKLRAEVGEMLGAKAKADSASLNSLAKMYDGIEPSQLAAVMASMDDSLVIAILPRLKAQKAGRILGSMPAERAAKLSSKLMRLN